MTLEELEAQLRSKPDDPTSKKEALAMIEKYMQLMQVCLDNSRDLADKFNVTFEAHIGGGGEHPWNEYSPRQVGGTYHGKGTENDDGDEDENGDLPKTEEGYWYWENSSLNC